MPLHTKTRFLAVRGKAWTSVYPIWDRFKRWLHGLDRGFSGSEPGIQDHTERQGHDFAMVSLVPKAEYKVKVPKGTYEVIVTLGTMQRSRVVGLIVNDQALNLQYKQPNEYPQGRFIVQVTDGYITCKAATHLNLYRIQYRLLSEAEQNIEQNNSPRQVKENE
jgi:hypothetical protein